MATLSEIFGEVGLTLQYPQSIDMDNNYTLPLMDECDGLTYDEALMIWIEVIVDYRVDIRRQISNMIGIELLPRLSMGDKWPDDVMGKVANAYQTNDDLARLIYILAQTRVTDDIRSKALRWGDILGCYHLPF